MEQQVDDQENWEPAVEEENESPNQRAQAVFVSVMMK